MSLYSIPRELNVILPCVSVKRCFNMHKKRAVMTILIFFFFSWRKKNCVPLLCIPNCVANCGMGPASVRTNTFKIWSSFCRVFMWIHLNNSEAAGRPACGIKACQSGDKQTGKTATLTCRDSSHFHRWAARPFKKFPSRHMKHSKRFGTFD